MFNMKSFWKHGGAKIISSVCNCCVLTSTRKSGIQCLELQRGWVELSCFVYLGGRLLIVFFPLWKQAEVMSYYLELALCHAVISELQTA